jgi:quercetin dioxygenase-like cupin family protein
VIKAYRLFTGIDGDSQVERGRIRTDVPIEAESVEFKESPPHSSGNRHDDPVAEFILTLAGILEFSTRGGETFTIYPGDVLLAEDHTGTDHEWHLVNDEPWKRASVVLRPGTGTHFVADKS